MGGKRSVFKRLDIVGGSSCSSPPRLIELDDIVSNKKPLWRRAEIECSVNGLIFFGKISKGRAKKKEQYYICNPITREYAKLPTPQPYYANVVASHGFGVCSKSGQYKVVRMFQHYPMFIFQVYTLGAGSKWTRIATTGDERRLLEHSPYNCDNGTFLNGNLHWLGGEESSCWWVSCFDLETETFTKFRAPTDEGWLSTDIGVLRGCLCLCNGGDDDSEFVICSMRCYEKKSWVKECVISKSPDIFGELYDYVYPMKVFGDNNGGGVLLMFLDHDVEDCHLLCATNERRMIDFNFRDGDCDGAHCYFQALFYTPSFVTLRDLFHKDHIFTYN